MNDIKKIRELAKNFSVLYVEDDLGIQVSMSKYLEKLFKEVIIANDGVEGLEKFKKDSFDLVITDLSMPNMSGLEMIEEIRKIDDEKNILITSAHSETDFMLGAIKSGIDGYIIKPIDYQQLNYELYKIVNKLQKFKESKLYKKHLENMIDQKSAIVSSLLQFQTSNYEKTLLSMVEMIEDRDTYTAGHSKRVAKYSKMIAEKMAYSKDDCTKIYQAAILHDIGKIATPDSVLLNPKHLNDIEYKLIKEHVSVGYKLLSNVPMFESLSEIVYSHHERYDGSGYPRALKADEIIPLARIIIVADAFDAMTTSRIYKGRKSVNEALLELQELSAIQFHPDVVKEACEVLKDVIIDKDIHQLPKTKLEEERFAYFYKDILTDIYNKNYLDLLLMKNSYENHYKYLYGFFLKGFSKYNKINSWRVGDKILIKIATILKDVFPDSLAFRIFGDDFILLSDNNLSFEDIKNKLDLVLKDTNLVCEIKEFNLLEVNIQSSDDIE